MTRLLVNNIGSEENGQSAPVNALARGELKAFGLYDCAGAYFRGNRMNISSGTVYGTGRCGVNLTNNMADADYVVSCPVSDNQSGATKTDRNVVTSTERTVSEMRSHSLFVDEPDTSYPESFTRSSFAALGDLA